MKIDSVSIGNAGEHLVMAYLLAKGFQAFMADRGNAAFDISCLSGKKHSLIRVKTTTSNFVHWSAKKSGEVFLDIRDTGDYVALVDIRTGIENAEIYIIPTIIVSKTLKDGHEFYISHPKKDGTARKNSKLRGVYLSGTDRPTNINYGYAQKWVEYHEAWHRLEE